MYSHTNLLSTACKTSYLIWKINEKNLRDCVDKKKKSSSQTHCSAPTIDFPFIRWTLKKEFIDSLSVYTIPYLLLLMLIPLFSIPFIVHAGIINCCEFSTRRRLSIFMKIIFYGKEAAKTPVKIHPFVSRVSLTMYISRDWVKSKKIP